MGRLDDLRDAVRVAVRRYYEVCRRGLAALGLTQLDLMNLVRVEPVGKVVNTDPAYRDVDVTSAWDELVRAAAGIASWYDPAEARDVVDLIGRLRVGPTPTWSG